MGRRVKPEDLDTLRFAICRVLGSPDPAVREIGGKMVHWLNGRLYFGDDTSLDHVFGLRTNPGQRSIQTKAMVARRDELIRRLAADHFRGASCNATAAAIHKAWSRYASSAWPRERGSDAIPVARINRPEFAFWQIMKLQDVVLSQRTIRSILAAS